MSSELGTFGKNHILYGYIGIKTHEGEQKKIKVDSYTSYETLEIGSEVVAELSSLGDTNIMVARKITHDIKGSHDSEQYGTAST